MWCFFADGSQDCDPREAHTKDTESKLHHIMYAILVSEASSSIFGAF